MQKQRGRKMRVCLGQMETKLAISDLSSVNLELFRSMLWASTAKDGSQAVAQEWVETSQGHRCCFWVGCTHAVYKYVSSDGDTVQTQQQQMIHHHHHRPRRPYTMCLIWPALFPRCFLFRWLALTLCQSQDRLRKSLMSCVHCFFDASEISNRLALYDPSDWRALVPSWILRWTVMNIILIDWSFSVWRAADKFSSNVSACPSLLAKLI